MPAPPTLADKVRSLALIAGFGALFLVLAWPGAGTRGIVAEEVQPFLRRYPVVLEWATGGDGDVAPIEGQGAGAGSRRTVKMPPYDEENAEERRPRWVATSQWPVIAYDGDARIWPAFIRGHQTALGSYGGIVLGPLLGDGIAGPRRANILLGFVIVAATLLVALRASGSPGRAAIAGVVIAGSFGMVALARTAYSFEVASRAFMMLALALLAPRGPPTTARAVFAGLAGGLAILSRGTIGVALLPAMAVLLLRRDSRPAPARAALMGFFTLGLPVLLVGLFSLAVPFRPGNAPLSGFPVHEIPERLLGIPRQAALTLAWLGDATSIWGPLYRGGTSLDARTLGAPALLAALPLVAAVYRLARGRAGTGEALYLAAFTSSVVLGAALYRQGDQFQLALAVEPMIALAIADQIGSIADRRLAALAGALALIVRAHGLLIGLSLDKVNENPMWSGRAQRAAVERLNELGVRGPELMTTVYNQAGVLEGWTGGIPGLTNPATGGDAWAGIRPLHAWPVLSKPREGPPDCALEAAWRALLGAFGPRYVLLTEGPNLYESADMDPRAIAASLDRVAAAGGIALTLDRRFPTESGGPGWALVRLDYPDGDGGSRAIPVSPACAEEEARLAERSPRGGGAGRPSASRREISVFRGLRKGDIAGGFTIERIEALGSKEASPEPIIGARITARRGGDEVLVLFEVRPLAPGSPPPPATAGDLGVFYRTQDAKQLGDEVVARAAQAIAERLGQE